MGIVSRRIGKIRPIVKIERGSINMRKKNIHVVPHQDQWATRREGASRVSKEFTTQKEAQDAGRQEAGRHHVELVTHRPNGQIREAERPRRET